MKQNRYNYRGRAQGSRMSYQNEIENLRSQPTAKQKKFQWFLICTLRKHGIDPYEGSTWKPFSRAEYARDIDRMVRLCEENSIPLKVERKQFDTVLIVGEDGFKGSLTAQERLVETKVCELD